MCHDHIRFILEITVDGHEDMSLEAGSPVALKQSGYDLTKAFISAIAGVFCLCVCLSS